MRTAGHLALAFALVTLTGTTKALTNETAITESTAISSQPANAWVYNPIASNNLIRSAGGASTPRMLAQWPALADMGIAQTSFVINGCAIRPPHVHFKATGLLYTIQASNLSVGFITEAGQLVQNYITTGASTIFPQGLLHYQQNLDCQPAYYTISYNSEDPGTQVIIPAYNTLPNSVAASSLGLSADAYASVKAANPKQAFIPNSDPDCVARCQAAGISVAAPAPSVLPTVTNAGR